MDIPVRPLQGWLKVAGRTPLNYRFVAKELASIVLIHGQDSLRADRALEAALKARGADASDVVRIWGDESSFDDVFSAANSRSLFSERTVVVVRRAEKLRGGGAKGPEETPEGDDDGDVAEEVEEKPASRKGAGKPAPAGDLPELDSWSTLVLVARKVDRRFGMWKKLGKAAELIDVDYLKGRVLNMAAAAEAKTLGLRLSEEILRETVEQSGPSLGRIVSEFEKMRLFGSTSAVADQGIVAVTANAPLYLLSDALMAKDKRRCLDLLDDALRQGEAGLRVLATLHGTIRRLAMFRALRASGVSTADAGTQLGIIPFKVADTERAARSWADAEIASALSIFAEADRRLKLSAPTGPLLTHALARVASGARA
jgi:DNA polymerase-3 subunit delta